MSLIGKNELLKCRDYLVRFARNYDLTAAKWLADNQGLAEKFMLEHLDQLSPINRINVYLILFGYFRDSYERILIRRVQLEKNSKCMEVLRSIEELHRQRIQENLPPMSDSEMLSLQEEYLKDESPRVRYAGALGLWHMTGDSQKISSTLNEIISDRTSAVREEALNLISEFRELDEATLQTVKSIADDRADRLQPSANRILNRLMERH